MSTRAKFLPIFPPSSSDPRCAKQTVQRLKPVQSRFDPSQSDPNLCLISINFFFFVRLLALFLTVGRIDPWAALDRYRYRPTYTVEKRGQKLGIAFYTHGKKRLFVERYGASKTKERRSRHGCHPLPIYIFVPWTPPCEWVARPSTTPRVHAVH